MNDPAIIRDDLIQDLCDEIFMVEGGTDDFEELSHDRLLVIIQRELPTALASLVLARALEIQRRPIA